MDNESAETKFDGAIPVFLVSDIASTMRWYATHLDSGRGVPSHRPMISVS